MHEFHRPIREFTELPIEEKAMTIACIDIRIEEQKKAEKKAEKKAKRGGRR